MNERAYEASHFRITLLSAPPPTQYRRDRKGIDHRVSNRAKDMLVHNPRVQLLAHVPVEVTREALTLTSMPELQRRTLSEVFMADWVKIEALIDGTWAAISDEIAAPLPALPLSRAAKKAANVAEAKRLYKLDLTQQEIAIRMGYDKRTVSRYLNSR